MIVTSKHGERMLRIKQHTGVARIRGLIASGVLVSCLLTMVIATLVPWPRVFAAAGLVGYGADLYLHRTEAALMKRLGQLRAGVTLRVLLRAALLVLLLSQLPYVGRNEYYLATVLALSLLVALAVFSAMTAVIRRHRTMPVSTRNIDLGRLRITNRPPRLLTGWPGQRLLHHELVVLIGMTATVWTHDVKGVLVGLTVSVGVFVLLLLILVPYVLQAFRFPRRERVLGRVNAWLGQYRPQVILYFSGSRSSAYQVNMWLETMARLDLRPLVLLRERHVLARLKRTDLPVLCVPSAVHLMNLDLSTVRVALYPANVGKNIHLLRVPTIKHVFVGHGDSDKLASVNPYSKAYDEVWVAGAAGRDRYALAGVGVQDCDIVEVGRPQLDALRPAAPDAPPARVPTVLYAPTWEGWTDDPGNTSLILAGENIVRQVLGAKSPVRLIYKPHPFTGTRSPHARRAHERILRLIDRANARRAAQPEREGTERIPEQREACRQRRDALEREMQAITERLYDKHADEAQRSRDGAVPQPELTAALAELEAEWHRMHWAALPSWEHQVVQGPLPTLYECFDQADLLISDISSVVSDFIATLKPYALTDTAQVGTAVFREQNTAARAAYVLTPDARRVRDLVGMLLTPERDVLRVHRERLRTYLLGPETPSSQERFNAALRALARRGERDMLERELAAARTRPTTYISVPASQVQQDSP